MEKIKPLTIKEAIDILDREIEHGKVGEVASLDFIVAKNVVIEALQMNLSENELNQSI